MSPLDPIHHHLAIEFIFRVSQGLDGLGAAWTRWQEDAELQRLSNEAEVAWRRRTDTFERDPKDELTGSVPLQVLGAATLRSAEAPHAWIQGLIDHGSPDFTVIRKKPGSERTDAEEGWEQVAIRARQPKLGELMTCWRALTTEFMETLKRGLPDVELPSPEETAEVADLVRIQVISESILEGKVSGGMLYDASQTPRISEDPLVPSALQAYAELSPDQAEVHANTLLGQHEAWQAAGLFPSRRFDFLISSQLAELAAFHGPLTESHRAQAERLDLTYPSAVTLEPGEDLSIRDAREESEEEITTRYFPTGFALVEVPDELQPTTLVVSTKLELLAMGRKKPLLVLLDLDLTHPDLAFLGLQGTRLRICDRAAPADEDKLLFTKVTLDGGVKPLRLTQRHPEPEIEDFATQTYALGRPLVSPFEGLKSAGELGWSTKIGGAPDWEQYPEDPLSPKGGKPMIFIAQLEHPLGGTAYAFLDDKHLITTVVTQNG